MHHQNPVYCQVCFHMREVCFGMSLCNEGLEKKTIHILDKCSHEYNIHLTDILKASRVIYADCFFYTMKWQPDPNKSTSILKMYGITQSHGWIMVFYHVQWESVDFKSPGFQVVWGSRHPSTNFPFPTAFFVAPKAITGPERWRDLTVITKFNIHWRLFTSCGQWGNSIFVSATGIHRWQMSLFMEGILCPYNSPAPLSAPPPLPAPHTGPPPQHSFHSSLFPHVTRGNAEYGAKQRSEEVVIVNPSSVTPTHPPTLFFFPK